MVSASKGARKLGDFSKLTVPVSGPTVAQPNNTRSEAGSTGGFMKLIRIMILAVAALALAACSQATSSGGSSGSSPWMLNFDSGTSTTNISVSPGYENTYATALDLAVVPKETDTGYTPITFDGTYSGTWHDTGLNLGTNSLKFSIAYINDTSTDSSNKDGHVVLSFKNQTGMDRTDRTGLTFTLKFLDAPDGAGLGLMPHLRYNNGTSENAVAFANEQWYYKTDASYYVVKVPFSSFTKPGYGEQSQTTIAALPASTVFNQLDFDIRMNDSGTDFDPNTVYHCVIDNVGFY